MNYWFYNKEGKLSYDKLTYPFFFILKPFYYALDFQKK